MNKKSLFFRLCFCFGLLFILLPDGALSSDNKVDSKKQIATGSKSVQEAPVKVRKLIDMIIHDQAQWWHQRMEDRVNGRISVDKNRTSISLGSPNNWLKFNIKGAPCTQLEINGGFSYWTTGKANKSNPKRSEVIAKCTEGTLARCKDSSSVKTYKYINGKWVLE